MTDTKSARLTEGKVPRQLIIFALPFLLANILQSAYSMVDMIVVGQFADSAGLSAVSIGSQVFMLITTVGMGIGMGGQIMIAQYTGAKDRKSVSESIGTMCTACVIMSVALTVIGLFVYDPILTMLNTPPEALEQARSYMVICLFGILFIFAYNVLCSILRAIGDSTRPMIFVAVSTVTNIILDVITVGYLKMGAAGAALSTVIAQGIAFICAAVYIYRHREEIGFDFKPQSFAIVGKQLLLMLKIGVPFAVQFSIINVSVMYIVALINEFGVAASAAYGVGTRIDNFACMPLFAVESAATTMIGQNIGAGKRDRAKNVVYTSLIINLAIGVVLFAVVQLFPSFFVRLFNDDEAVVEVGVLYLRYLSFTYVMFSLMTSFNSMVMGVGFSMLSLVGSLLDGVVLRLSLSWLFCVHLGLGLPGVFLGTTIAPIGATLPPIIYFYSGRWKNRSLSDKTPPAESAAITE